MEIVKKYVKDELTMVWQPKMCIHSEKCYKGLPRLFNPKRKPWVNPEEVDINTITKQIDACPSGALSYILENQNDTKMENTNTEVKVQIFQDGPLIVSGPLEITHNNGEKEAKEKQTAFCRCGHSTNKPFCDGSHKASDFKG